MSAIASMSAASYLTETPEYHLDGTRWRFQRVELISLLKHEEPGVYLSDRLPDMNELDDHALRPLDRFEQESLGRLLKGEDVVTQTTTNRVRMLGSLRAARQCVECHSVERGSLLGDSHTNSNAKHPSR